MQVITGAAVANVRTTEELEEVLKNNEGKTLSLFAKNLLRARKIEHPELLE